MITIKECKASEYIDNLKEINSFIQTKKKVENITNIDRLLNLIKIYFETVIYHQNHSSSKFLVKVKGKYYESVLNSYDENGKHLKLSITEVSEKFIAEIIEEIRKNITLEIFEKLITLINSILLNGQITLLHKLLLINSENISFPNEWDKLIRFLPEELADKSIQIRKNLIIKALKEPNKYEINENIEGVRTIFKPRLYKLYKTTYKSSNFK